MKTTILTIALALTSALSALAQTVMRENSTVYFQTNVFLHDDPTNALHSRIVGAGYLPLAGYDGLVVLGTRTRGYAASTNLGEYGFAAGFDTSADDAGFAAGANTSAGDYGFAAGRAAKGALGSFVFADNSTGGMPFNRTNRPNEFSARAAGGVYFDTPMMAVTGTNTGIGLLESGASLNLTTGMTFTATTIVGFTNEIKANSIGAHLSIAAANGEYPTVPGGNLLLTPGIAGPNNYRVKVTRGIFEADEIKAVKMGLAQVGPPGSEVLRAWLQSDGTNLFFISTVPPGFTNALTTNSP